MKKFSPILAALLFLTVSTAVAQTKKVFAHYMVCYPDYGSTVDGFKRDIQDAQRFGIDGFALNSGLWDATYQRNVALMFQAAEELGTGFKLFVSADRCCGLRDDQIIDMVASHAKSPNYFTYNGRQFFSSWGALNARAIASTPVIIKGLQLQGINTYFIPFIYPNDLSEHPDYGDALKSYNATWSSFCDGYYYFGATGIPNKSSRASITNAGEAVAKVFHDNGKTFMASVSPEYWGDKQPSNGRRYYEYNGGEGLAKQWKSIIENQGPEWVELATWNDWTEGTYFSPIPDITQSLVVLKQLHNEVGFYKSHLGFAELNKYYIQWYKTGRKPAIAKDELFFFYRTHPKAAQPNDPKGRVSSIGGDVNDEIYLTTLLTAPAQIQVSTGGATKAFSLPAGISNFRAPFSVGQQLFKIVRNGKVIASGKGDDIISNPASYDFNEYSGYITP